MSSVPALLKQLIEQSRTQHQELIKELQLLRSSLTTTPSLPIPTSTDNQPIKKPLTATKRFKQVKTEEELLELEAMLEYPAVVEEMLSTLDSITDFKLTDIVSPVILDSYNYDGIKSKKSLKDLNVYLKLYAPIMHNRQKTPEVEVRKELQKVKNRLCKKRLSDKRNEENFSKMPRLAEEDPLNGQYVDLPDIKIEYDTNSDDEAGPSSLMKVIK